MSLAPLVGRWGLIFRLPLEPSWRWEGITIVVYVDVTDFSMHLGCIGNSVFSWNRVWLSVPGASGKSTRKADQVLEHSLVGILRGSRGIGYLSQNPCRTKESG